jgi:AraC-like DNA-binding protein
MPSSAYTSFNDPDQLSAAVRAAEVKLVVTKRINLHATLMRTDLHALWLQAGEESFSRIAHAALAPNRVITMFPQPGSAPLHWRGKEAAPGDLILAGLGEDGHQRCEGPTHWASLSLPPETFTEMARALIGADLRVPASSRLLAPPPAAMRRLSWLHGQVARLARDTPWVLTQDEPARALEQATIHALMACLAVEGPKEDAVARRRGTAIVARLEAILEMTPNRPLHLPEICIALGISERTLQTHCRTHLGVGPNRYLLLRRLHMARRQLRAADASCDSVTKIATGCGFWELGRFAVAYRHLFGESPSATLRRAPDDKRQPAESA